VAQKVGEPQSVETPSTLERPPRSSLPRAMLATARPRQWAKNVLVFGAPATGGVLLERATFASTMAAFIAFCLVASGVYFVNDIVDEAYDREHPTKRLRPIAAGLISHRLGWTVGVALIAAGGAVGALGARPALLGILAGYVALSLAYTLVLRSIALLDIAAIAGGFLLRAVAGGVASDVPLSMWFLVVAGFGSLFLAAGKRHAEYVQLGEARGNYRPSLNEYSESYLRFIQYASSTVAMAAYAQWAFEGVAGGNLWSELSIIPFVLGIFRYALLLDQGRGATPEDAVLTDVPLLFLGSSWVLMVAVGVYLG
jgi:decaprenyl-phosphate phosphoribosyltransferase